MLMKNGSYDNIISNIDVINIYNILEIGFAQVLSQLFTNAKIIILYINSLHTELGKNIKSIKNNTTNIHRPIYYFYVI